MIKDKKVIFITGTPGVGKTTIATYLNDKLSKKYQSKLIKINELAIENGLIQGNDIEKGYKVVDIVKLDKSLFEIINQNNIEKIYSNNGVIQNKDYSDGNIANNYDKNIEILIIEGHLSHLCNNCDKVIVLRLDPLVLKKRLKNRKYSESKIQENLEAEALAVCTVESFEKHGNIVNELNTTEMSIEEVLANVEDIIFNKKSFSIGNVDFMEWLIS